VYHRDATTKALVSTTPLVDADASVTASRACAAAKKLGTRPLVLDSTTAKPAHNSARTR